jgi:ubiquinone/menaquinone biosynthesis C-methylase UbiE
LPHDSHAAELAHHEVLYSGLAQKHFAKAAVRELRRHLVSRILEVTGAGKSSRVPSLGCGIGDTELLLLSTWDSWPVSIFRRPQSGGPARMQPRLGIANVEFCGGDVQRIEFGEASLDAAIGIFFLHHVPYSEMPAVIERVYRWLKPGGVFYGLDPNRYRLRARWDACLRPA